MAKIIKKQTTKMEPIKGTKADAKKAGTGTVMHNTIPYILNPGHPVTVSVIGIGGTGSAVLTCLARINEALLGLDHPGLHVYAWDPDTVEPNNVGRQLFSPADIGINKATVMVGRINRHFGYTWSDEPSAYTATTPGISNLTISCVDTIEARRQIYKSLSRKQDHREYLQAYYWLDFGNGHKTGQAVLGTVGKHKGILPTVLDVFPALTRQKDKPTQGSCSLAQALGKQDLFINSALAQLGTNLIWNLFRAGRISHHGLYLNLETMNVNPIKVR